MKEKEKEKNNQTVNKKIAERLEKFNKMYYKELVKVFQKILYPPGAALVDEGKYFYLFTELQENVMQME